MDSNNQPVSIVPDVEHYKPIHIVRIGKGGTQFLKVPPTR